MRLNMQLQIKWLGLSEVARYTKVQIRHDIMMSGKPISGNPLGLKYHIN